MLPINPPYVSSFFADHSYMGNCALVSFEAIKAKMIEKGDISKDQIDSKFFFVIILKVSTYMKHTINENFSTAVLLLIV